MNIYDMRCLDDSGKKVIQVKLAPNADWESINLVLEQVRIPQFDLGEKVLVEATVCRKLDADGEIRVNLCRTGVFGGYGSFYVDAYQVHKWEDKK